MKKFIFISALVVLTSGCATYQEQGAGLGLITGAVIGNQFGGGTGNAIATIVGAAIGSNAGRNIGAHLDTHRNSGTHIEYTISSSYYSPDYSVCRDFVRWSERTECRRGVDRAFKRAMERRKRDAYDAGYRSNQGYYD